MHRKRKLLQTLKDILPIGLLCSMLFVQPAPAQSGTTATSNAIPQRLTLSMADAVALALEHNRDVLIAEKDIDDAKARIREVYGRAYPQLNGSVNYTRNIELPVLFLPPNTPFNPEPKAKKLEMGLKNDVTAGLSASQVLFDPQLNTGIQIAKRYRKYAELASTSKQEEITRDVKVAFYSVLLAERLVDVAKQSVELAQAHHDNIKAHYDQGTAAEFDLLRAEVQLANAKPQLSRRENELSLSKDNLKLKIGLAPQTSIDIIGDLAVEAAPVVDTESDINNLIASNTTIRTLKAQEAMLKKNIAIENAAYFPVLSAFANYNYQAQDNTLKIGDYEWVNTFMAGVTLSVPLFNGFQTKYRVAQARIGMDRAVLSRMQVEDGIRLSLDQAKLDLNEAKERYDALAQSVGQARRAVDIADVRFRSGVGTQLEVLDSQTALAATQSEQALAAYDYFVALAKWEQLTSSMREN